jgi:hypothetical protein
MRSERARFTTNMFEGVLKAFVYKEISDIW